MSTRVEYSELFLRWYAHYPRRVGKLDAYKAFLKLDADDELVDLMIAALRWQVPMLWATCDMRYIPHPATYLNGRRFEDEKPTPVKVAYVAPQFAHDYCTKCRFGNINTGAYKSTSGLWERCDCAAAAPMEQIARANEEILRSKQSA